MTWKASPVERLLRQRSNWTIDYTMEKAEAEAEEGNKAKPQRALNARPRSLDVAFLTESCSTRNGVGC